MVFFTFVELKEKKFIVTQSHNLNFVLPDSSHVDFIEELHNEPMVQQYCCIMGIETKPEIAQWIARNKELYKTTKTAIFIIYSLKTEKKIGLCGIRKTKENQLDISYKILPEERRKGYAKECIFKLINMAKEMQYKTILAQIHEQNTASQYIAEKLGFLFNSQNGVWKDFVLEIE